MNPDPDPITHTTIRTHQFPTLRRGGLDPDPVRDYLNTLADQLAALHRQLIITQEENARLKRALRDWQTSHAIPPHHPGKPRPTWPTNSDRWK